jgi:BirA family transcriptional regulator, biotin operon repressor / biotin---[acetyl-CoA-carboxylase] ligase
MSQHLGTLYDLERLRDRARPRVLRHARVITSTNDWARQEVESGVLHAPALLVADFQSTGRGRGKNTWWSALGNVAATFVVPRNQCLAPGLVPLLAGLAVRRALGRLTARDEIGLKWPNDLVVGPRKVAGLLCERLRRVDLIGVGVNVNLGSRDAPGELRERITSLRELTGNAWDLTDVVTEISHSLDRVLSVETEDAPRAMLQEYSLHHWPTGKIIQLTDADRTPPIEGRCGGIDAQGRLIVKNEQGTHAFLAGHILSVKARTTRGARSLR